MNSQMDSQMEASGFMNGNKEVQEKYQKPGAGF